LELRMSVKLRIQNTNDLPIDLNEVSVQMDIQARPFATGFSDVGGGAASFGETVVATPAIISSSDLRAGHSMS
jgi:hypothetical protein